MIIDTCKASKESKLCLIRIYPQAPVYSLVVQDFKYMFADGKVNSPDDIATWSSVLLFLEEPEYSTSPP